ncbi:MAG: MATE family efflux transporter [Alphaproteobacteria bacterium]|jgi:MATE family multidrug resistance protein|nr:MATE family efflux transporter [Alphaproteobacteria bacterium]MDP6567227.1 MATE family efflux transporter [Alphaproteobacteria bacterium]MDP6812945.1 MATE family efflux transporter [Alphaproteobacteria bacterium]
MQVYGDVGRDWRSEVPATLRLATPLVVTNLAQMALGTTDVLMMGWLGAEKLAAGALAANMIFPLHYFGLGVLGAAAPIISQALGARAFRQVRRTVRQGFWVAIALGLPASVALWFSGDFLRLIGQVEQSAVWAQEYLRIALWGFLPGLWYVVLRSFTVSHSRPRSAMVITCLAIAVNAVANYLLMFGHFGLPRLELRGAAIATVLVEVLMFGALLAFVLWDRRLRRYRILGRWWRTDWPLFHEILRLGLPIGLSVLAEAGMFAISIFLMGWIGTVQVAAHAIAMQCAGIAFMIPLGLSSAASIRVGYAIGAGRPAAAWLIGRLAIALGLLIGLVLAVVLWLADRAIVGLFLDPTAPGDIQAFGLAVGFLHFVALFQIADAAQGVTAGVLRGYKDTRVPMLIALLGYWGVGTGAALLLAFPLGLAGAGIWTGLALGLLCAAGLLMLRFYRLAAVR